MYAKLLGGWNNMNLQIYASILGFLVMPAEEGRTPTQHVTSSHRLGECIIIHIL